MRSVTGQERVG